MMEEIEMNQTIRETVILLLDYIRAMKAEPHNPHATDTFSEPIDAFARMVYDSGIWDENYRAKLKSLEQADLSKISLEDVYSYFTAIIAIERCFSGFIEQKLWDGTLEQLSIRYLDLTQEDAK